MKILYYDCFAGISGDMNLGAMIDLGVDANYLKNELKKLNIDEEFYLEIKKESRKGIQGTKVDVILNGEHHEHRHLKDIQEMIYESNLDEEIKDMSFAIFQEVAKAEAKVHGVDIQKVHFHEVGAVDSIIDIVGAAICFHYLKVDKIISSPVQVGGGFVKCAHGLIPVPAPAVVEILKGIPINSGAVPFETTTPTGAAILKAKAYKFTSEKQFIIDKIGYGVGSRDTDIPNLLRVFLGRDQEKNCITKDKCLILECNIDDMNPEIYDYVYERLFEKEALDVFMTSIIMKKGRPAIKLSVLCKEEKKEELKEVLLRETSTLGVREYSVDRSILKRDFVSVKTSYGDISVKRAYVDSENVKFKPEYEDCKKAALEKGVSISKVLEEVYNNLK